MSGLHCLSAFPRFTTSIVGGLDKQSWSGLHCLSAFRPPRRFVEELRHLHGLVSIAFRRSDHCDVTAYEFDCNGVYQSLLTFGCMFSAQRMGEFDWHYLIDRSPLPFGVSGTDHDADAGHHLHRRPGVSIAFRRFDFCHSIFGGTSKSMLKDRFCEHDPFSEATTRVGLRPETCIQLRLKGRERPRLIWFHSGARTLRTLLLLFSDGVTLAVHRPSRSLPSAIQHSVAPFGVPTSATRNREPGTGNLEPSLHCLSAFPALTTQGHEAEGRLV
jgi:hypothetical protein